MLLSFLVFTSNKVSCLQPCFASLILPSLLNFKSDANCILGNCALASDYVHEMPLMEKSLEAGVCANKQHEVFPQPLHYLHASQSYYTELNFITKD